MANFMKIDSHRLEEAATRTLGGQDVPPGASDVDSFEQAMRGEGRDGRQGSGEKAGGEPLTGKYDGPEADSELASPFQLFGNPLDTMFGQRTSAADVVAAQPAADTPDLDGLTSALVDRILVSDPRGGENEIRITLSDNALPGTEVRLTRGTDGMLTVRLETDNASSFQTLVSAQDGLKNKLESLEKGTVRVEVSDSTRPDDGDAQRRSAGYTGYAPEGEGERRG